MCPDTLVSEPLGPSGSVTVVESAGKITISLQASQVGGSVSETLSVSIGAGALLAAWSAATSNSTLKAILSAAAVEVNQLPA